jgi:hypothetical protein
MRVILLFLLLISTGAKEAIVVPERALECVTTEEILIDTATVEGRVIKILADSGYTVRMQQIILAQAKYESGSFRNPLTKKWNNVFAMLHSKYDPYSLGNWGYAEGRYGYAVYKSLEESVYARIWYSRKKKYPVNVSVEEYIAHIKAKGYFTGNQDKYLDGIKKLIDRDENLFKNKSVMIACK